MDKNFDWKTYINNYEDLQKAGINTEKKARRHWITYGKKEGRSFLNNINREIIIDKTYENYEPIIKNKLLIILACHINSSLKYNTIVNNIQFLNMENIDIVIINSTEFMSNYNLNICKNIIKIFHINNDVYSDFGKFYYVLTNFDYMSYKNIIFINDSIILVNNINKFLINIDNSDWDLYGFNDSIQGCKHYQSFLFSIKTDKIQLLKDLFIKYKNNIKSYNDLIKYYEFGLYKTFSKKNCYITISHMTNGLNLQFTCDGYYKLLLENDIYPIIKIKRLLLSNIPLFILNKLPNIVKNTYNS
jgi:hypothetical protein